MSDTTAATPETPRVAAEEKVIAVVSRKTPVIFAVLTVALALAVGLGSQEGDTGFRLATKDDFFELPKITVPAEGTAWLMIVILALITAESARRMLARRTTPLWLAAAFSVVGLVGFLSWAAAGGTIPVVGLLAGSLALAVPLVFGALGGVLGERAGVVNIAIDGQLLAGAFAAAIIGSITGSVWAGIVGALVAGALVALIDRKSVV